jgi:hypothetical protein
MTVLAWGAKLTPEEREKVRNIAANIGASPSHLMACMAFETGRSFAPWCRNPGSSATGLIQFMESTAQGLGTSTAALAGMTVLQQLDYVWDYFKPFRGRLGSLADVYMAILWPPGVGQPDNFPVFKDKHAAYAANKGLDVNHDGVVTKAECAAFVEKMLAEGLEPGNRSFEPIPTQPPAPIEDHSPATLPPAQPPENRMPLPVLALISLFGPMLAELLPTVARAFSKGTDTPQKIEAASKIIEVVTRTTAQPTLQGAIEAMKSSPEVLTAVRNAVVTQPDIMQLLEIGGGIEAARAANLEMQQAPRSFLYNPAFWITLLLLTFPVMLMIDVFWVHAEQYNAELRTQIVTSILGVILVISGYWLGTSAGSVRKTDIIAQQGASK